MLDHVTSHNSILPYCSPIAIHTSTKRDIRFKSMRSLESPLADSPGAIPSPQAQMRAPRFEGETPRNFHPTGNIVKWIIPLG